MTSVTGPSAVFFLGLVLLVAAVLEASAVPGFGRVGRTNRAPPDEGENPIDLATAASGAATSPADDETDRDEHDGWSQSLRLRYGSVGTALMVAGLAWFGIGYLTRPSAPNGVELSVEYWLGPFVESISDGSQTLPSRYAGYSLSPGSGDWTVRDQERLEQGRDHLFPGESFGPFPTDQLCGEAICVGTVYLVVENQGVETAENIETVWQLHHQPEDQAVNLFQSPKETSAWSGQPATELVADPGIPSVPDLEPGQGTLFPLAVVFLDAGGVPVTSVALPLDAVGDIRYPSDFCYQPKAASRQCETIRNVAAELAIYTDGRYWYVGGG